MNDVFDNDANQQSAEKMAKQTWGFNKDTILEVLKGLKVVKDQDATWEDLDELRGQVKKIILDNKKAYLSMKQKEAAAGDPF